MNPVPVTLLVLATGGGATADAALQDGPSTGGAIVNGAPEAVVVVGRTGTVGSWTGTPRGGSSWTCGYYDFETAYEAYNGHTSTMHIDNVRMGKVTSRNLPADLDALPARSTRSSSGPRRSSGCRGGATP